MHKRAATPRLKIDIRGVIADETNRLLLGQDRDSAQWSLPGGYAEGVIST